MLLADSSPYWSCHSLSGVQVGFPVHPCPHTHIALLTFLLAAFLPLASLVLPLLLPRPPPPPLPSSWDPCRLLPVHQPRYLAVWRVQVKNDMSCVGWKPATQRLAAWQDLQEGMDVAGPARVQIDCAVLSQCILVTRQPHPIPLLLVSLCPPVPQTNNWSPHKDPDTSTAVEHSSLCLHNTLPYSHVSQLPFNQTSTVHSQQSTAAMLLLPPSPLRCCPCLPACPCLLPNTAPQSQPLLPVGLLHSLQLPLLWLDLPPRSPNCAVAFSAGSMPLINSPCAPAVASGCSIQALHNCLPWLPLMPSSLSVGAELCITWPILLHQ